MFCLVFFGLSEEVRPGFSHLSLHANSRPSTVLGWLALTLLARYAASAEEVVSCSSQAEEGERAWSCAGPLTVLCCDNIPHNGPFLKNLVLDLLRKLVVTAHARDAVPEVVCSKVEEVIQWINSNPNRGPSTSNEIGKKPHVTFPSSMVDRITPAMTKQHVLDAEKSGVRDELPVVAEDFLQFLIEDNFASEKTKTIFELLKEEKVEGDKVNALVRFLPLPTLEYLELQKLRILNAGHSAMSFAAALFSLQNLPDGLGVRMQSDLSVHRALEDSYVVRINMLCTV